jgi:hypothetical protein
MTTTEPLITPGESPTLRETLDDVLPVIGVVFVAGPPVVFLAAPWVLLALMLAGPFALVVAFVAVVLAAVAAVVALAAIATAPVLLVRHLHHRYQSARPVSVPVPQVASMGTRRVAA